MGSEPTIAANPVAEDYALDSMVAGIGSDAIGVIKYYRSDREGVHREMGNAYQLMARVYFGRRRRRLGGKYPNESHKYSSSGYGPIHVTRDRVQ